MALNYSVSLRPNPHDKEAAPKAYATAQTNGELTLKQLGRRIAAQTTVSRADVAAVLTATVDNLLEALTEGKQVDFGELGKFRLQIMSTGTDSLSGFTAAHITGVNIQYIPGADLKTIFGMLEFQPVASRAAQAAALRAEKEGKVVEDLLKNTENPNTNPEEPGV
ncbi:MAG: HU family DNA-binding protein [Phocaeicola sp.]|uniref:HU family DNA-binding protein n=1 Tax=Phocaeicola sp. TaxID=2773926 RepID=UPI0023CB52D0|nr:HU family DNA-binding protein [Phocaeicola sp.]MDE5678402.1 HU family DNA-binding protein [Phocaeicola sp.]MDE6179955.1 HU family DNA-binding protein [Phocaeicola sp.]